MSCNAENWIDGFTFSEFNLSELLAAALVDQERKHRKQSPFEIQRVQSERVRDGPAMTVGTFTSGVLEAAGDCAQRERVGSVRVSKTT